LVAAPTEYHKVYPFVTDLHCNDDEDDEERINGGENNEEEKEKKKKIKT